MLDVDFSNDKLRGPGFIVEIDETMMNYKCKSYQGRSPSNRTDSICIVKIQRAFALVIPDKKAATLIPLIVLMCVQIQLFLQTEPNVILSLINWNFFMKPSATNMSL